MLPARTHTQKGTKWRYWSTSATTSKICNAVHLSAAAVSSACATRARLLWRVGHGLALCERALLRERGQADEGTKQ